MLGRAVAALRRPRAGPALAAALHLAALALFVHGFLLTRVHLAERSTALPAAGVNAGTGENALGSQYNSTQPATAAPFDRVVWLMIDALRYDFVISDGRYSCGSSANGSGGSDGAGGQQQAGTCHQGHMPYLAGLARQEAARSFMFIADAPTTTTQRLKSLATGGLPSFFDVSNSFSAGAVTDDNLLDQLASAGRRMAFLGDTTWQQLFPRQWAWSRPYPCFNVRDLHTVDDGVWQHLLPTLRQPGGGSGVGGGSGAGAGASTLSGDVQSDGISPNATATPAWDGLLVAHYLGVDHCGHTHGVASAEMAAKLRQMDSHVQQVVEALLQQAGPGGAYERTLLLVSGDHGQTLGGDHGGGSPEEVDSALVAVDVGTLHATLRQSRYGSSLRGQRQGGSQESNVGGSGGAAAAVGGDLAALAPAPCRANCSCGVERNQCAPDLPQMDLTPTLAAMLGVPIPFGNLGKLSAELWQLTAHRHGAGTGSEAAEGTASGAASSASAAAAPATAAWGRSLAGVLLANARQVHRYLNTYAATAGASFSRAALASLNEQFSALEEQSGADTAGTAARCYSFLEAAAAVARAQWTQFGELPMVAGLALFAATLLLQAAAVFGGGSSSLSAPTSAPASSKDSEKKGTTAPAPRADGGVLPAFWQRLQAWQLVAPPGRWRLPVPAFRAWLAGVSLVHGLGIFSFFYLLSEGRMVCILVAAACAALALAVGRASRAASKGIRGVVGLGIMSLRCNALMALLGVAHHTGQGFWARLTVHDPQPEDDVERGWHGKLGGMKRFGGRLAAAAGISQLPPAVLLLGQHSLLCTLPILLLAAAMERLQRGRPRSGLQRLLCLVAFASVAAYHQVEDATKHGLLPKGVTLGQLVSHQLWPRVPAELAALVKDAVSTAVRPALAAWPEAAPQLGAHLLQLPLSTLLPHMTYAACSALAAIWLARAATRRLRGAAAATAAAQLLLAALLQVSDRQAPLILLLALLELAAIAKLLGRRAELQPAGAAAGVAGEAGALVALVAAQLFYVTGHLCEFAGLQYTAGFVGFEEFHLWRSGALLLLNTFGGMVVALLALPAVVAYVEAAAAEAHGAGQGQAGAAVAPATAAAAAAAPMCERAATALRRAVASAGLVRTFAAFCAALSAGVQRRHLYAWALFAPRFSFAAVALGLTDLALILLSLIA